MAVLRWISAKNYTIHKRQLERRDRVSTERDADLCIPMVLVGYLNTRYHTLKVKINRLGAGQYNVSKKSMLEHMEWFLRGLCAIKHFKIYWANINKIITNSHWKINDKGLYLYIQWRMSNFQYRIWITRGSDQGRWHTEWSTLLLGKLAQQSTPEILGE